MLEYIGTVIWILLLCMLGGGSIALAVQSYKKRRYFWFGLDIMWVILDTLLIAAKLLDFYF